MRKKLREIAYFTADVDTSVRYYEKFLGKKPSEWSTGQTAEFLLGDVKLFLHKRYNAAPGEPPAVHHIAFVVEDVDMACDELVNRGLRIEIPPADFDWGRSAYLTDPDGNWLELHELADSDRDETG